MSDIPELSLNLLEHPDEVPEFLAWLTAACQPGKALAIDTETTGFEWWTPGFTRLVQFGDEVSGWAIPCQWYGKVIDHALTHIHRTGTQVIMHNAKFDMHALDTMGYTLPEWRNVHDTMVMHHLYHSGRRHGLKPIGYEMFGPWANLGQRTLKNFMRFGSYTWATVPVDAQEYWAYGVMDAILTAKVYHRLRDQLTHPAYATEMAYMAIMYGAESRGLRVDVPYCTGLRDEWACELENLALRLKKNGIDNPSSNQQVAAAMKEFGWTPDAFTPSGEVALDKFVMARLITMPDPISTCAAMLVDHRRLSKWTSTYLNPFIASGGVVHPNVRTLGARTGRSSITTPALQTLPSNDPVIRNAVLPYADDQCIYAIDYSGQEYRILAALSQDKAWLNEFRLGDGDPHTMVADMLGVQRSVGKTFNFASVYGAGDKKLALTAGITESKAKRFREMYAKRFPGVHDWVNDQTYQAYLMQREGVEPHVTTIAGRTVYLDEDMLYAATNYRIQGSGADVLKQAVCRLEAEGLSEYLMIPVHDEGVFSFPKDGAEELARLCTDTMTDTTNFILDLPATASGPFVRWGAKYDILEGHPTPAGAE